jgi:hypothetical protein
MQHKLKFFSLIDPIIIIAFIGFAFLFWPQFSSRTPATVVVFRDNIAIAQYPLSPERDFTLMGKEGPVTLRIRDNGVRMIQSTCSKQLCIQTGTIKHSGQQIVCAPNHIIVELSASGGKGPDAVTQ